MYVQRATETAPGCLRGVGVWIRSFGVTPVTLGGLSVSRVEHTTDEPSRTSQSNHIKYGTIVVNYVAKFQLTALDHLFRVLPFQARHHRSSLNGAYRGSIIRISIAGEMMLPLLYTYLFSRSCFGRMSLLAERQQNEACWNGVKKAKKEAQSDGLPTAIAFLQEQISSAELLHGPR